MAQVHSATGGEDQVLIFIGTFIDVDGVSVHGIPSIEAHQPAIDAHVGIRFPDDQGIVRSLLDHYSVMGMAVRVRRSPVFLGLHRGPQGPAVRSGPVAEGDIFPHYIHPGDPVDQQPSFDGHRIGGTSFRCRPADFHGSAVGVGIKGRIAGVV